LYRTLTFALLPKLELLDDEDRSILDAPEDGTDASPLSPPRVAPRADGDLAAGDSADAARLGAAEAVEAASPLASPSRSVAMSEGEAEARRRRQAEERLVSHAIKYAEVGRVFDVSFDGRAFLGGSGDAAAARPATAAIGSALSTRRGLRPGSGSSSMGGAGAGSLARPATALSLARPTTTMRPGTNAGYAGMSRRRNPLDGRLGEPRTPPLPPFLPTPATVVGPAYNPPPSPALPPTASLTAFPLASRAIPLSRPRPLQKRAPRTAARI